MDADWIKQLTAEQLVTVPTRRGFNRLEWQKIRERNEALDNRVYARAAAWIAGLDQWQEKRWRELEVQVGIADQRRRRHLASPIMLGRRRGSAIVPETGWRATDKENLMAWTQSQLDLLKRAYAAGTLRVTIEGRTVEYGSADDLMARIRTVEAEIAATAGTAQPTRSFATFSRE